MSQPSAAQHCHTDTPFFTIHKVTLVGIPPCRCPNPIVKRSGGVHSYSYVLLVVVEKKKNSFSFTLPRPLCHNRACLKVSGVRGHWPGSGRPRGKVYGERASFDPDSLIFCYFSSFSKLSVLTMKHVQSIRKFFGFQKNIPWCFLFVFLLFFFFFFFNPKCLFTILEWPQRPTTTKRKVKVIFV